MRDLITFQGQNPLSIYATGSGEYMKEQCAHLVDLFEYSVWEQEQSIRGDMEELEKDNFYER